MLCSLSPSHLKLPTYITISIQKKAQRSRIDHMQQIQGNKYVLLHYCTSIQIPNQSHIRTPKPPKPISLTNVKPLPYYSHRFFTLRSNGWIAKQINA